MYLSYHCLILLAGVEVILPNGLKEIVKGTILLSADDVPAKAVITCMKQFNGRYGCQLYLQEGDPLANAWTNGSLLPTGAQYGAKNK